MLLPVLIVSLLGIPLLWALAFSGYILLLTINGRQALPPVPSCAPSKRFLILVPAHDEELLLGDCLKSLNRIQYPGQYFSIAVIADNCDDSTATIARALQVRVLERRDRNNVGKGYALAFGIENALPGSAYDAVVVIDADTIVSPNLLSVFNDRLCAGASAIQARHSINNWDLNWFTRLAEARSVLFNHVLPAGRTRLRLSADLTGNGMCFSRTVLLDVPWSAYSLTEDVEYGRQLLLHGHVVEYAPDARVLSDTPTCLKAAKGQRRRCEVGRWRVFLWFLLPLLRAPLNRRNIAATLDLAVPSFTAFLTLVLFGATLTASAAAVMPRNLWLTFMTLWFASMVMICCAVVSALLRECPMRVVTALARVPWYLAWKNALLLTAGLRGSTTPWARAERERVRSTIR